MTLALIILDGWGHREEKINNAIAQAKTPYFDSLLQNYPHTLIDGSGPAVGLPEGIMGNSEVGHMNIGAGRIVLTGLSQIYTAIENKSFFANEALLQAIDQVGAGSPRGNRAPTLHLMGLLSDGAVHSHQDHLYALLKLAKKNSIKNVAIHCFLDGRDTPPNDGIKYLKQLQDKIVEIGVGHIASLSGRYFAMDRDGNWDRTEKAFLATCGKSPNTTSNPALYIRQSYQKGIGDEFLEPVTVLNQNGQPTSVFENDAMIFFNFRADRARQIAKMFDKGPKVFVCMTPFDKTLKGPIAFTPTYPKKTLAEILAKHKLKQLRIAETEKYAHVTFFFNGGIDEAYEGEDRVLIPSPKDVATYDQKPEMSAFKVKDELLQRIASEKYAVIICNFANADMVGHTAKPEAIIKAIEVLDQCLKEIVPKILEKDGEVILTADHGNAELTIDEKGEPMTAHTTNLVPFILVSQKNRDAVLKDGGRLCDVAPTMLKLLGIKKPQEMTGAALY